MLAYILVPGQTVLQFQQKLAPHATVSDCTQYLKADIFMVVKNNPVFVCYFCFICCDSNHMIFVLLVESISPKLPFHLCLLINIHVTSFETTGARSSV